MINRILNTKIGYQSINGSDLCFVDIDYEYFSKLTDRKLKFRYKDTLVSIRLDDNSSLRLDLTSKGSDILKVDLVLPSISNSEKEYNVIRVPNEYVSHLEEVFKSKYLISENSRLYYIKLDDKVSEVDFLPYTDENESRLLNLSNVYYLRQDAEDVLTKINKLMSSLSGKRKTHGQLNLSDIIRIEKSLINKPFIDYNEFNDLRLVGDNYTAVRVSVVGYEYLSKDSVELSITDSWDNSSIPVEIIKVKDAKEVEIDLVLNYEPAGRILIKVPSNQSIGSKPKLLQMHDRVYNKLKDYIDEKEFNRVLKGEN